MTDNENLWKGKPITYVDQNILDFLLKEPDFQKIFDKMQIVYSNETLAEIRRSGANNCESFLELLKIIEAFYFYIEQKEKKTFLTLKNCDPFQIYKNINEQENYEVFEEVVKSMSLLPHKFYGGKKELGFSDIYHENNLAFNKLMVFLKDQITVLKNLLNQEELDYLNIKHLLNADIYQMQQEYESVSSGFIDLMMKDLGEGKNLKGLNYIYQENMQVAAKQLNNITGPNVLKKIWEVAKNTETYQQYPISEIQFWGLDKHPIYPDQELTMLDKIRILYDKLNFYGFNADTNMHHDNRYIAALSDQEHAVLGSCCEFLFSMDARFVRKVSAIYEYLNIKTQVAYVVKKVEDKYIKIHIQVMHK